MSEPEERLDGSLVLLKWKTGQGISWNWYEELHPVIGVEFQEEKELMLLGVSDLAD